MLEQINWKKYQIFAVVFSLISLFFNWTIGLGFAVGTLIYFINLFISSKKFPRLDGKPEVILRALSVMLVQGILTILMAIGTYYVGKLPCFFAGFAAMIVPNIYFFIVGSKV
ncbi:MAG: ATP synthase subunit I [Erysipelotrichaceae bacterium]|nr:ATP synthase subunit I [Erysipelotrichaceae bacterium]